MAAKIQILLLGLNLTKRTDRSIWTYLSQIFQIYEKTIITEEDGTERVETVNTANPGDAIVTGKKGERYVVSADDFRKLYEPLTDENGMITDGRYLPKNVVKCMKNPTGQEIIIDAPWGGKQTGGADCMILESQINGDRYLIEIGAFEMTYEKNDPTAESNDKE